MKRTFLTILFFMSLLPCIVYAEELFLYKSEGQWGYVTDDGIVVIAASFSEATPFYNGIAKVRTSVPMDHYSLIDFQGNEITPPCCDIYEFDSAFIYTVDAGDALLFGFYDKQSGFLSSTYDAIKLTDQYINEQEYIAVQDDDKWGFVHRSTGAVAIPCVYDEIIEPFQNGYALVCLDDSLHHMNNYILIDAYGNSLSWDRGFMPMSSPSSAGIITIVQDGMYGLADISGCLIIEPQYLFICSPANDRFWFQNTSGYWGVMDEWGTVIVEPCFQNENLLYGVPPVYVNGYALVRLLDQVIILDLYGNISKIEHLPFTTFGNVLNGTKMFACYDSTTGLYRFMNVDGVWVTLETYEDYSPLRNGFVLVMQDGKWGLVNGEGDEILPCDYEAIFLTNSSTLCIIHDGITSYTSICEGI